MASGHVNRSNRPNTWLLRPMLQREDSSCQPGAVHTWPLAELSETRRDVGYLGISGLIVFAASLSAFDPNLTSALEMIELVRSSGSTRIAAGLISMSGLNRQLVKHSQFVAQLINFQLDCFTVIQSACGICFPAHGVGCDDDRTAACVSKTRPD
jgi:hypothetical protein